MKDVWSVAEKGDDVCSTQKLRPEMPRDISSKQSQATHANSGNEGLTVKQYERRTGHEWDKPKRLGWRREKLQNHDQSSGNTEHPESMQPSDME